jgi:serine/threonine-protein kinase
MARAAKDRFSDATTMKQALESLYQGWRDQLAEACRGVDDLTTGPLSVDPGGLRSVPIKVGTRDARARFALDSLWRPERLTDRDVKTYATHADGTVVDAATGLQWQRVGSEYPVTWTDAHAYVADINTLGFAGASDWRLPTVDELVSLLERPPEMRDLCLPPVFDPSRSILWTSDRKSYTAAWFVSAALAFVGWQDCSCRFHVRAVRTLGLRRSDESPG